MDKGYNGGYGSAGYGPQQPYGQQGGYDQYPQGQPGLYGPHFHFIKI